VTERGPRSKPHQLRRRGSCTPVLVVPPQLAKRQKRTRAERVAMSMRAARSNHERLLRDYWRLIPWPAFCEAMEDRFKQRIRQT